MVKRRVGTHVFVPDPTVPADWRGERSCATCYRPERNTIHTLPQTPASVTEAESRRLGEKSGD